jgi:DNA invertase Pin-like site-specific DNA recombinase
MKALRFAALVRVSTEEQEKKGESLPVQRATLQKDVERLGGEIVAWFGGAEHATAGWEKRELHRLMADVPKGKFDALIVAYGDRWSRDNAESKKNLELLRQHRIRFFVAGVEKKLHDPTDRFTIGIETEVAEYIALLQLKKAYESRSKRLAAGVPSAGQMPFGRTFKRGKDRATGEWGTIVDPENWTTS